MKRVIRIFNGNEPQVCGELRYDRQGKRQSAAFSYSSEWLSSADAYSIDPSLPLVSGFQFQAHKNQASIFHGCIADSEPDGRRQPRLCLY